jgi:CubicO group peptidase (beta-lactamase class C family)
MVDPVRIDDLRGRIAHDVDRGWIPAAQVAVALDGALVVEEAFGVATTQRRLPLFSVSKVLVAAAVWRLFTFRDLAPADLVVERLPWFTGGGKDDVAVEHLLLHTAGFPNAPLGPPTWFDAQARRERIATWHCATPAGREFDYHPTSAFWVLAELLAEVTGLDHCDAVEHLVTEPLGLPRMLGIDDETVDVCDAVVVGTADGGEAVTPPEVTHENLLQFNRSDVRRLGVPGAGGFARAGDVALLYQALLHDDGELWDRSVLEDGTGTVRVTQLDVLRGVPANRTLGLVCAGDDGNAPMRGFSRHCSPRAFGHDGAAGQVAWADPESGLSCCFLTAGIERDIVRQHRRSIGISDRAAMINTAPDTAPEDGP